MADANHKRKRRSSGGAKSKNKGSSFERKICKTISLWLTDGKRDDVVWRTAGSGGRATVRAKRSCRTANAAGDMCATDPIAQPFIDKVLIEMKKGYTNGSERIDVLKLIDSPNSKKSVLLLQWWLKAKKEARFANREEVWIVFERDRGKAILMTRGDYVKALERRQGMSYPHPTISTCIDRARFIFTTLENFIGWYNPAQVVSL